MRLHLLLPGDGIGPEVVAAAASILRAVASHFGHQFDLREAPIGGAALRRGLPPLPDETLAAARESSAILLGAVGDPAFDQGDSSPPARGGAPGGPPRAAAVRELPPGPGLARPRGLRAAEESGRRRHRHAGRARVDRRSLLRRASRHCRRRRLGSQHDAVFAARDRAHRAPRLRSCPRPQEARDVGGQGERARDLPPVAAGGHRRRGRAIRT